MRYAYWIDSFNKHTHIQYKTYFLKTETPFAISLHILLTTTDFITMGHNTVRMKTAFWTIHS